MKRLLLFLILGIFSFSFVFAHPTNSNSPYDDWRMFGHDTGFTRFTNSNAPANISNTPVITKSFAGDADTAPVVIWDSLYYFSYSGDYSSSYAFKLNASNISQVLTNSTNSYAISYSPSYYKDNLFIQQDTYLYQVNASNLSQVIDSEYIADSTGWSQIPVVFGDSVWTGAGNYNPYVKQFNASNISKSSINYYVYSRPYEQIPIVEDYAYFSFSGNLYQANSSNISKVIRSISCAANSIEGAPSVGYGSVYKACTVNSVDYLFQFNASNISQTIANFSRKGWFYGLGNGFIYFSNGTTFFQLNASNISQEIASYSFHTSSWYAVPAITSEYVFVSAGSIMYQLNASNVSQKIGNYSASSTIGGAPVLSKGFLYFGSIDDKLYQLGIYNPLPAARIDYPLDEKVYLNVTQLNYSLMQNSTHVWDKCWYSNDSGSTNFSTQTADTDFTNSLAGDGWNNWTLFCNDSNNNLYSEYTTFYIDSDTPIFTNVTNKTINQTSALSHQISANDSYGVNCFSVNDSSNFSISCSGLLTNATFLAYGNYSLNVSVYDYADHYNYTIVTIAVLDSVAPALRILYPANNSNMTDISLDINYSVSDSGIGVSNCWYSNDSFSVNYTLESCVNISSVIWAEGVHNLRLWANDSVGNRNLTTLRFTIDTTSPVFNNFTNPLVIQGNSFSYQINATDSTLPISCFSINDTTNFNVNCTGYLINNTILTDQIYSLNVSVNDSLGNTNSSVLLVNVTTRPFISVSILSPSGDLNVTQNGTFSVSVNVSCSNADCGEVNTTLYAKTGNTLDIDIAFVCYSSSCSDADDITGYLTGQGFRVTKNPYNSWTDANLNSTAFDVIVVGGYYDAGYYAFDSASDAARDAFENEQIPVVVATHYAYPSYYMGITNNWGSYDSSEDYIDNINTTHTVMTGFGTSAYIDTTSDYLGYLTTAQMTDNYSKLFVAQDVTDTYISGFALEAGQATVGTNPQKFIHLGFNTYDTYPTATAGNNSLILKQSICWAATGSYDCNFYKLVNISVGANPFYTNSQNPYNSTLVNNSYQIINFTVNATIASNTYDFFVSSNKTSYISIGNISSRWNITVTSTPSCIPVYQNTSWSEWQNQTSCRVNNTILQNKSLVQFDTNCSSANTTFWDYQEIACDFCTPTLTNTSWSDWSNLSCVSNLINQSRQRTQYDENNCGEIANQTITEYISELDCSINLNILSPANTTYNNRTQIINISSDGAAVWYNWNGTNITYSSATSILFNEGTNNITAYANNSFSSLTSFTKYFTTDTIAPNISLISPENSTYNTTRILLNISSDGSNIWYNWNGTNVTYSSADYVYFSNETVTLLVYVNDSAGNLDHINVTFFSYSDDDFDGVRNGDDFVNGSASNINSSGITSLNVSIGGNYAVNTTLDENIVTLFDSSEPVINFTYNFSSRELDLSKIRIIKTANAIIVNLSGQLQDNYNKTIFLGDNNFVSLCVKDAEVSDISEVSSTCTGTNETNMTGCLGGSLNSNGISCTDLGSTLQIDNLRNSAVLGVPESSESSEGTSVTEDTQTVFYPTSSELVKGYTRSLSNNWQIKFKFENITYTLKISKIYSSGGKVLLSLFSKEQEKNISVGEEWKLNLNNDSFFDYLVSVNSIKNNFVNISILEFNDSISSAKIFENSVDDLLVSDEDNVGENSKKSGWIVIWLALLVLIFFGTISLVRFIRKHGYNYTLLAVKHVFKLKYWS